MLLVFQIISFEYAVVNTCDIEQDIWNHRSMCYQTPLGFHVRLGEPFSRPTFVRMMKKHDKSALMEILQVFGTLSHVDCQSVL